jgi:hypothetical protein
MMKRKKLKRKKLQSQFQQLGETMSNLDPLKTSNIFVYFGKN